MSITYSSQSYLGLQDYILRSGIVRTRAIDSTPLYAHPVDSWIIHSLNATPVKAVMNRAMDALVSYSFGPELASGVFIDQKSFPELFEVLSHCAKTLGIPLPHAAIAKHGTATFNAYTAGTDDYAFINIAPALTEFFSNEEICFVIGHECGHIASGHMVYHTLASQLANTASATMGPIGGLLQMVAGVPLMAWFRRSEITADRAGLLCVGDIKVAERALLKLVIDSADIERVDIEDYLRRFRSVEKFHRLGVIQEHFASHPLIPKRIEALRLFANSELYYTLINEQPPDGNVLLSQEQLNRQVKQMVKP